MSVEAMSAPSAIGSTTAVNTGPVMTAFGPEISSSFAPISNINADIFSMPELIAPTADSFNFDRTVPGTIAFDNTRIEWQAPSISEISDVISEPKIELSPVQSIDHQPESISDLDLQANNFIQEAFSNYIPADEITEPEIEIGVAIPIQTQQQEVIADVMQALRVEEALIATKVESKIAHETVLRIFTQTQEAKITPEVLPEDKDPNKPPEVAEIYFEHDTNADEARKKAANVAIGNVASEIADEEIKIATGHDIAEFMPNPEPKDLRSEIAKDKDGSYEALIAELEAIGEISSTGEAGKIVAELIDGNHAVRTTNVLRTEMATDPEIQKVLKS